MVCGGEGGAHVEEEGAQGKRERVGGRSEENGGRSTGRRVNQEVGRGLRE